MDHTEDMCPVQKFCSGRFFLPTLIDRKTPAPINTILSIHDP